MAAKKSTTARPKATPDELPHVEVKTRKAWRDWLTKHHETAPGAWVVTFKKDSGQPQVPYGEIVEELLCVGWVDSKAGSVDEKRSKLLCRPRNPKSGWSGPNKERIERLEKAGLMRPAGRAMVALAKKSGTWTALDHAANHVMPDDLATALATTGDAKKHWDAFPPGIRKQLLEWVGTAKKPETRAARITEIATKAAKNVRANQWREKNPVVKVAKKAGK